MCEFCARHGEGGRWYLRAKNYSDDLLSDTRRRGLVAKYLSDLDSYRRGLAALERLERAPRMVKGIVGRLTSAWMKGRHFGQVVPIEDVERILGMMGAVVRMACLCRHVTQGREARYCYGLSLRPDGGRMREIVEGLDGSFLHGPDTAGLEVLDRQEALEKMRGYERQGLCHSVWTFGAPFIGGICNCDRMDCLAMRCSVTHGVAMMFRAEWVAQVDPGRCSGCRECMRLCPFGAIGFSATAGKVSIDPRQCWGCGICRAACAREAIRLQPRAEHPVAHRYW